MDTHTPDASPQDTSPIDDTDAVIEYVPMPPTDDPAPDKAPGQELEEWLRETISLLLQRAHPTCRQGVAFDAGKPALVVTNEMGTFVIRVSKVSNAVMDKLHG